LATQTNDAVTIHQVLHYLDDPSIAVREAARVLRPGGRLVIVDFAPHQLEELRERGRGRDFFPPRAFFALGRALPMGYAPSLPR
jgi:SAM-dependent methyltransferase